jgi:Family of unknown function (DUF6011)
MSTTASSNQLGFLGSLIRERARQLHIPDVDAAVTALREQRITRDGASATIDKLLALKTDAVVFPPEPVAGDPRGNLPKNRYAGQCVLCGGRVAEGAGTYRRGDRGGWDTLHLPGQCAEKVAPRKPFGEAVTEILGDLPDGLFAVPSVTGSNDLTFVKFATNKGVFDSSKKGQRYVRHIVGGYNDQERLSIEWITKVAAAVRHAGAQESAILFGQTIGQCGFCTKPLTRKYSRGQGYGPTCADNHGLPFDYTAYAASPLVDGAEEGGE